MKFDFASIGLITFILFGFFFWNSAQSASIKPLARKSGFKMKTVEKGRYLSKIASCNDCHTAGYLPSEGNVPENLWLTGDTFGWSGPWGTTYGSNLRLFINDFAEKDWIGFAITLKNRPPMPWFNLNAMTHDDLRAIYQFVRYLGLSGKPAPEYVPAGQEPSGPHAIFPPPPK
jgi:mono/diheme cytochrome c family protein